MKRALRPSSFGRVLPGLAVLPTILFIAGAAQAQLLFEDQGDAKLGTQPCGGNGCWSNYARVVDVDNDGDLDLVSVNSGGFFSPNPTPQPLTIYTNDGAGNFTNGSALIGNFSGAVRQVAFGDIDNDGDLDMYAPAADQAQLDALFVFDGGALTNEASTRLPASLSSDAGAARFGDVDNDGDLDLLVANGYATSPDSVALYLNDGAGVFTAAPGGSVPATLGGADPDDVDLADFDGDFDLDVYINMHSGPNSLWLNNGDGTFTNASANLPALGSGSQFHYGPAVCDVDNDGDRDIIVDNTGGGYSEQLLLNNGMAGFTDATSQITGNSGGDDDNLVSCIDYDGDGAFDIVVGSLTSSSERLFRNAGGGNFSPVAGAFSPNGGDNTLWMDFGDLNGDGRLDAFTAQGEAQGAGERERVYFGTADLAPDTAPPLVGALDPTTVGGDTVVRFAVRDAVVTDSGPHLRRAFILADGVEVPARFMGGDIYRAVVPPGAETLVACAEDLAGNVSDGCGGSNPSGSTSSSSASSGPGATSSAAGTGSGSTGSGAGGAGADDGGGEEGCDCSTPGAPSGPASAAVALAAVALAFARVSRRRQGQKTK